MTGAYFLLPTLLAIFVSILVVRGAAIALMMTGLDKKRAVFQAISAFTGTGFTTREAESVVGHEDRRKIISWLMILGNAGFVTVIVATTTSMIRSRDVELPMNIILLIIGILIIYKIATSTGFIRQWESYIETKLDRHQLFEKAPMEDLLHLAGGYGLVRAVIADDSPLAGGTLSSLKAMDKAVHILGVERGDDWIPMPTESEQVAGGDRLILYGLQHNMKELLKKDEQVGPGLES
jgi:hypothetical protein